MPVNLPKSSLDLATQLDYRFSTDQLLAEADQQTHQATQDAMKPLAPAQPDAVPSFEELAKPFMEAAPPAPVESVQPVQPAETQEIQTPSLEVPSFKSLLTEQPDQAKAWEPLFKDQSDTQPQDDGITVPGMPEATADTASMSAPSTGSTGDPLRDEARAAALKYGVNPDIFENQIDQESGFNPKAGSPAGAQGIAQIMPQYHPGVDPSDPHASLDYAAKLMRSHLDTYGGDYRKALAAYNAGPEAVAQYGDVPPFEETQRYVNTILSKPGRVPTVAAPMSAPISEQARDNYANTGLDVGSTVAEYAGKPYVFGGGRDEQGGIPGAPTDCSGFVSAKWREMGLDLPAHTDAAYTKLLTNGRQVSQDEAQQGDVVFYMGAGYGGAITYHMGIYAGPGKILDMSTSGGKSGVAERPITHAGSDYVIMRDPRVNGDTPSTKLARGEPIAPSIVHSGIAEQAGGKPPSQAMLADNAPEPSGPRNGTIKGVPIDEALEDGRAV
jgi:cell wall-associated NlpC family hydrolase